MSKSLVSFCALIVFVLFNNLNAQTFPYRVMDSLNFVDASNNPYPKALAGGFQAPQFSSCDLDNDGKKDLVIYDRIDGRLTTLINTGGVNEVKYRLDNRYATYFPSLSPNGFMLMRDYNLDGKEDIFTVDNTARLIVYKNISSNGIPAFDIIPQLYFRNISAQGSTIEYNELGIPFIHLPGIGDVDFDGDLDILTYTNQGGAIGLYKNLQVENGLPPDSMKFMDVDWRWGDFYDRDCNTYFLNQGDSIGKRGPSKFYNKRHTNGSSICMFDADNDQDMDIVLGNEGCDHMVFLENGRKNYNTRYDTIISYDTNFVSPMNRAKIWLYPAGYYLDIDNDGKRDFITAPNSNSYPIQSINQVFWFKNNGLDLAPIFGNKQLLFNNEILDIGARNSWACADWDKDGDMDCLCATNADSGWKNILYDRIYLFENKGTASTPVLKLVNTNFGNFASNQYRAVTLAIADMDNDGKLDLVTGNERGDINFFKNTSPTNNTLSPTFTAANSIYPGFNINAGFYSAPAVGDVDGDGLKDLVIGSKDTFLKYYQNVGTKTVPDFTFVTKFYGQASPKDSSSFFYIHDYCYDSFDNPTCDSIVGYGIVYEKYLYSMPQIGDLNGDGKLELLVGNTVGNLKLYAINKTSPTAKFVQYNDFYYYNALQNKKVYNYRFGNRIAPALVNLEGDSVPEILLGISRGGVKYLKPNFNYNKSSLTQLNTIEQIAVYPNPANAYTTVELELSEIKSIKLITTTGQVIIPSFEQVGSHIQIQTRGLNTGIYFLNIETNLGLIKVAKLEVSKQ
ncbi:MAG: T9SS type A sorting domain-containing protein [bacterium]|nr:T9SS type A sorting domain-containing protein [bacterium]